MSRLYEEDRPAAAYTARCCLGYDLTFGWRQTDGRTTYGGNRAHGAVGKMPDDWPGSGLWRSWSLKRLTASPKLSKPPWSLRDGTMLT